jgi:xanthine dehydrogenase large subunit
VPEHFQIALWDGANREDTIYRSKAVGEPPLMLAISVFAAIADAIHSLNPAGRCRSMRRRRRKRSCAPCRR